MPITEVQVDSCVFSSTVKPPGSANKTFFLGGAGVRGLEVKFTAIGVYLEEDFVTSLAVKWKGKAAEELKVSEEFYKDIVTDARVGVSE